MSRTYLVGHMKEDEFVPCEVSTDMSEPQMHGVYVSPDQFSALEVVGILDNGMIMQTDLEDDPKLEAVEHLRDALKEKLEEEE